MKLLKTIILLITLLCGVLALAGFFLPNNMQVNKTITINSTAVQIFPHINDLRNHQQWSPWAAKDPNMEISYSGNEKGAGQISQWHSKMLSVGTGSQKITKSIPPFDVETELQFEQQKDISYAKFHLEPTDTGVEVTWSYEADFGNNILSRYFGVFMKPELEKTFSEGLNNLKLLVEKANG